MDEIKKLKSEFESKRQSNIDLLKLIRNRMISRDTLLEPHIVKAKARAVD